MNRLIETAEQMEELGAKLGQSCQSGSLLYLKGDLGAGKTTIVRGFLKGLGFQGKVKSPTYTLVEPYDVKDLQIFHFDLYRLEDALELENIGFRDYFDGAGILLVEWPEKAASLLEDPDLMISINILDHGRSIEIQPFSSKGSEILLKIQ